MYDQTINRTLTDLGSSSAAPGSGACCALTLSLAVEAQASQLALTLERDVLKEHRAFHENLRVRIEKLRAVAREAYAKDCKAFGAVVVHRTNRDNATLPGERREHVKREITCLDEANGVLIELITAASEIAGLAVEMYESKGISRAKGEASVAKFLAQACSNACADILALNVETLLRRRNDYDTAIQGQDRYSAIIDLIPDSEAKGRLQAVVAKI